MNTNKIIRCLVDHTRRYGRPSQPTRLIGQPASGMTTNASISQQKKERETFQDVLPAVVEALASNAKFSQVPEVGSWIKQVLDYNLIGGKKSRGLATVFAYETLEKPQNITEDSLRRARVMGWCVEMLQAYFLVIDDMMDGSSTRRGMPCWYRLPNVGLGAINDSILIHSSIYEILRANFSTSPLYVDIVDLFNEAILFTSMGQHLDYTMAHRNKNDYSLFTIERYYSIVKHKTSYYTFKLPISLGYLLANNDEETIHKKVEAVCMELGKLFQIQDDYLDCYGDVSVTGKVGTDIQEGKCSWLAVNALMLCNEHQRSVFIQNYGDKDPAKVETIKRLYDDLRILELYKKEERNIYDGILQKVEALPANARSLNLRLLDMMYKRTQ